MGALHFLKKSRLAETYEFDHFNNFAILLGEQTAEALNESASRADIFLYQPTPALKYGLLSTEEMLARVVPKGALAMNFGYGFNHGFYPLVHHGQWQTGRDVLRLAKDNPEALRRSYDDQTITFDCALRFVACVAEQFEREKAMDIKMADFVLSNFQKQQLFICENHPASAYLAELARRILRHIEKETGRPQTLDQEFECAGINDANLPGGMLIHSAAVKELGLQYAEEQGAHKYFGEFLERLIKEKGATPS